MACRIAFFATLLTIAGCTANTSIHPQVSDVDCVRRLYERPGRTASFPTATAVCSGRRPIDLTGARYYQLLASTDNIPFVSHDPPGTDKIVLTGSRIPYSTNEPAPQELHLY